MYLANNLKFLRKKSGKTQDALSLAVKIGRTTIANYEAGISEPNLKTLISFATFFGVTVDALLLKNMEEVSKSGEKDMLLQAVTPDLSTGYSKMPRIITVDRSGNDNIVYVPVKARAGYLSGYGDTE